MQRFQRLIAVVLTFVFAFVFAVPVFADPPTNTPTPTATVTPTPTPSGSPTPTVDPFQSWENNATTTPDPTEAPTDLVQKCLGYNIVDGTVSKGKSATVELIVYDSGVASKSARVTKQYATLGACDFSQSPANSAASTVTIDSNTRNVVIRMTGLVYAGTGNSLVVDCGYAVNGIKRNVSFTLTIREAPSSSSGGDWSSLAPTLLIDSYLPIAGGAELAEGETPEAIDVEAGSPFDLLFTLRNASASIRVRNMTVQVGGGEIFVQTSGSDTLYLDSLGAGETSALRVPFTTSASSKPGAFPVTLTIKYEYYDNGAKQSGTDTLTMMVTVHQLDRIKAGNITVDSGYTGSELAMNYSFINTGFTTLYNAEVQVYDQNDQLLASKYVGTVEASKEVKGSDLSVIFMNAGDQTLRVVLAYQNEAMENLTFETTVSAYVDEYIEPTWEEPAIEDPTAEPTDGFPMWIVWVGVAVVVVGGAVVLILLLLKKKKAKAQHEMEGYDEDL